jgi:hypothetical protein
MNCREIKFMIDQYADGFLEKGEIEKLNAHLAECAVCRREYQMIQRLKSGLESLPSLDTPGDITEQIMDKINRNEVGIQSSWRHLLQRVLYIPRHPMHLVGATAAVLVVFFLGFNLFFSPFQDSELMKNNFLRVDFNLEVSRDDVRSVAVVGEFNDWNPNSHYLQKTEEGDRWSVTLELEPGRYEYMYVLNGETWITDPGAFQYNRDGFGNKNAIIELGTCS